MIEKAGRQIKSILQKSDPFKPNKCQDKECFPCKADVNKQTNCRKDGIVYHITCNECKAIYVGESSRNANCRGKEHMTDYETNRDCSVMLRHKQLRHANDNVTPTFTMTVKQIYGDKCLDRQISENIQINNIPNQDCYNSKIDWHINKLPRATLTWE